jgi:hypothetical protein
LPSFITDQLRRRSCVNVSFGFPYRHRGKYFDGVHVNAKLQDNAIAVGQFIDSGWGVGATPFLWQLYPPI